MGLRTKITLISISIVIFSAIVFTSLSIYNIKRKGQQDIEIFKKEETQRIKKKLKEFTDIAYKTIETNYKNSTDPEYLKKYYEKRLKDIAGIVETILDENYNKAKRGIISDSKAREIAYDLIRDIRFDDGGSYAWICNTDLPYPILEISPAVPSLEGKPFNPREGGTIIGTEKNFLQAAVETCNENGDGFIQYEWRKLTETGFTEDSQKLSYVKKYDNWNIIIGIGVYIEDAIENAKQRSMADIRKMRYADESGYFYIFTNEEPFPKMIMSAIDEDKEGKYMDDPLYNCAMGTDKNLFVAFADVCNDGGSGYVDYYWKKPQPDGSYLPRVPKLSYGKLFEPWGWITGTGLYMDSIDIEITNKEAQIQEEITGFLWTTILASLFFVIVGLIMSFIFARSVAKPIGELVTTIKGIDIGGLSSTNVELKGTREIKELGSIFNKMTDSLHESVELLKATTSEKEKIESELNIARDIQLSIIPKIFPAFPDRVEIDIYGKVESAKAVGGDLFDFLFVDEDHFCFAIGDVSGKGVPASLFMAITSTIFRAKVQKNKPVSEIVTEINKVLCQDNDMAMFVTFFMSILNVKTGELQYCNAGHNPPWIIKNQKDLIRLDKLHGLPVAVIDSQVYEQGSIKLDPSDSIILYTDGVTEAENAIHEQFEEEKLVNVLKNNAMESPKGLTDAIYEQVHKFADGAEQSDDITVLTLTYRGNIQ